MAAINLISSSSPILHTTNSSPSPRLISSFPQNTLTFSHYTHPTTSKSHLSISLFSQTLAKKPSRSSTVLVRALSKLSEADSVEVSGEFPASSGVYAVYDKIGDLQFIGISRNVSASVQSHVKSIPELCASVKVGIVDDPDRTALTQAWKSWMEEHISTTGKVPPGNESGNSTWVRQPPKKNKPDLRLTPGRHISLTVPLEQLIDRLVKENKVVAFIKGSRGAPQCGFSQRVVGILESEGVDYESVDVLDEEYNPGLRDMLKKYSSWPTFPQVFVNGELVGGCDILSSMYEKGELATLFKK